MTRILCLACLLSAAALLAWAVTEAREPLLGDYWDGGWA